MTSAGVLTRRLGAGLFVSLALGCGDSGGGSGSGALDAATADAAPRVKERTVTIELFKTAERPIEEGPDGELVYGPLTDIGGVDVCVARQRPAFRSFEPFEEIPRDEQICATSEETRNVHLNGVPADSDLVITLTKEGYEPATLTFRADAHDVAAPMSPLQASTLLRTGASDPWLERTPPGGPIVGTVAIWADAWWDTAGTLAFPDVEQLVSGIVANAVPAEGVRVEVDDSAGDRVIEVSTLRERPRFLSLAEGLYRMRFSHPRMTVDPEGLGQQFMTAGLPTSERDTIEVPVLAGHLGVAVVDAHCAAPEWSQAVEDLATCTLTPADAGAPP